MHALLSWWHHLRFRVGIGVVLAIDCAVTAVGVALLFFGGHAVVDMVGWTATLIGLARFAYDWRERIRQRQRIQVGENYDYAAQVETCALPPGFVRAFATMPVPGGPMRVSAAQPYVTSPAINALMDGSANPLARTEGDYAVPDRLQSHRLRCVNLKKPALNERKVGLRTDPGEALLRHGRPVRVQRTDYFSGVSTNEMACQQFEACKEDRHGRAECQLAVSDYVIDGGTLIDLADSGLSNHIGVSTLVVTADDQIVLQTQGDQMVSARQTVAGASGSVDWADLEAIGPEPTLQALVRHAMQREAAEELSARFDGPAAGTRLTGYARYLARGGKPEFFGISRTTSSFAELRATRGDLRYVAEIAAREIAEGPAGLLDAVERLLREGDTARRPYSPSMVVCLHMAADHLRRGGPVPSA